MSIQMFKILALEFKNLYVHGFYRFIHTKEALNLIFDGIKNGSVKSIVSTEKCFR